MFRFTLALTLLICNTSAFAQRESELDIASPDLQMLELKAFATVNDLRLDKKISPLSWDEVLYRAAKDHADYLLMEKSLSHVQKSDDKRTPFKRVKLHGGITFSRVGENLLVLPLGRVVMAKGRQMSTQSYRSAALTMAQLWLCGYFCIKIFRGARSEEARIQRGSFSIIILFVNFSYRPFASRHYGLQLSTPKDLTSRASLIHVGNIHLHIWIEI